MRAATSSTRARVLRGGRAVSICVPPGFWKMPLLQRLSPLAALGVPAPHGGEALHLPRQGQSREEKTYLMQKLLQASGR